MDCDDDHVPIIYHFGSSRAKETPDTNDPPLKFVYSFLNWLVNKKKKVQTVSDTTQPADIFNSENLPVSSIRLNQQTDPWTSGYNVIKYICVMYNQVIYKGYGGDGTDPNDISPSILDVCNNHKRTTTLLNDLLFLSRSLYPMSMANSK